MPDDPRVQELIEEMLESGKSPEDVCRDTPELLPQVREGWRKFRALEAQVIALFPDTGSISDDNPISSLSGLPQVPGYELIDILGHGGVGVVYKALHLGLNRTVALKMLLSGAFASRAERQRFAREAVVVAGLRHPNVVQVYDVGDLEGRPYFTMEFVEGGSLAEMICGTPRPAHQAAELLVALADAIIAAHRGGVVHRDLKPSNVLIAADGTPKVGDFGLARHLEVGSSLTQTGAAVGTPSYMAPEQARGESSDAGPASDLYALGAVLYELLTGRPPFRAASAAETVYQVIHHDPVPPSRLNANIPRDLETICLKCLRKDPRLRYADAAALADDLRRFLRGDAISARPENRLQRLTRRVRRRPALSASITAGAILALTLIGGGLWLVSDRAATMRAADQDLREMAGWLEKSSWREANAALERAKGRLEGRGVPTSLRQRLERGALDLALVARLDSTFIDQEGRFLTKAKVVAWKDEFETAFRQSGIGTVDDPPEVVAEQVKRSNIRDVLVASLDNLASSEPEPRLRNWALQVASLADRDVSPWHLRARDPKIRNDRAARNRVIADAPVDEPCIPLLISLARQVQASGEDAIPFLTRIQRAHPGDFWANFWLGIALHDQNKPAEAIRYFQASLAMRPRAAVVYRYLGVTLARSGRAEEAIEPLRRAVSYDPRYRRELVSCLHALGKYQEALEQCELAIQGEPEAAVLFWQLGVNLEALNRQEEAVLAYRKAVTIEPKLTAAQKLLRAILLRRGQLDEARKAWQKALDAEPPDHESWYGYAELCLYLKTEDEYLRTRRDLLARFGASTDPFIAERTARTCLLRATSRDELQKIVVLGERAWSVDRSKFTAAYPYFLFVRGLSEYRQGHFAQAISQMQGEASRVLGPAPGLVLAMAQHQNGQQEDARKTLAKTIASHNWQTSRVRDQDDWIYHTLRREAEAMIQPSSTRGDAHR